MNYNAPAIAPRGQAKANTEIFRLLAARMGLDDPCFGASDELMLEEYFAGGPGGVELPELARRYPLALVTPKTHLFLNSTFANQRRQHGAQPAPYVVIHPDDAGPRAIGDGAAVRIWNDRGEFEVRARVSDETRPQVLVAPMGWWNGDYPRRRSAQVTTSQRLTALASAPIFNDNRVEIAPLPG